MSNVQYREVARKAAVGERIKIVAAVDAGHYYKNGDVLTVSNADRWAVAPGQALSVTEFDYAIRHAEYVVLEPVTAASSAPVPQEPDVLYANFRQFVLDNADAIRAILPALETQLSAQPPVRKAQPKALTRAEVIAKATADVAELLTQNHPDVGGEGAWFSSADGSTVTDRCEFVINREKRTVTALLRYTDDNKVWRKGIAKCSPADVFHAEIGKAIALRRALGLAVPDEYVNAPKPQEKRVGMRVVSEDKTYRLTSPPAFPKNGEAHVGSFHGNNGKVIDDTDVDYNAISAKEAA